MDAGALVGAETILEMGGESISEDGGFPAAEVLCDTAVIGGMTGCRAISTSSGSSLTLDALVLAVEVTKTEKR